MKCAPSSLLVMCVLPRDWRWVCFPCVIVICVWLCLSGDVCVWFSRL